MKVICLKIYLIYFRTYAKTLYIAHDNFDELHTLSHGLAQLCGTQSPNYFYSKTNSNSSQITFILIEGCFKQQYEGHPLHLYQN